jgi:hypothetical protein
LSYLEDSDADSDAWRRAFVRTFVERDMAALVSGIPPAALMRFWTRGLRTWESVR